MTVAAPRLLERGLDSLALQARAVRAAAFGTRITYSPKVFIPLTHLCRDRCGYCTFAQAPSRAAAPYLSPEQVLAIAVDGAQAGCHEALFTLGEGPEARYQEARDWLREHGYASTVDYLAGHVPVWSSRRPGCCRTPTRARCPSRSSRCCAGSRRARG